MFSKKVVEKIKSHILWSVTFSSENRAVYEIISKKILWGLRGHKWRHKMAHTRCMLDKQGYTHTHTNPSGHPHTRTRTHLRTICNAYCFSTSTKVSWTFLNVKLYIHCLSCYLVISVFDCQLLFHRCSAFTVTHTPSWRRSHSTFDL
jgi:hypothetical protein